MPPKAEVFYVEDNKDWLDTAEEFLEKDGHRVAERAYTLNEALSKAERLKVLGINVAVVDGNLTDLDTSGHDGDAVVEAIRKHAPGVKIVGMSMLSCGIKGVDVNVGKANLNELGKTITNL